MVGELIKKWLEERPILGEFFTQRRLLRRLIRRELTETEAQALLGPVTLKPVDSKLEAMIEEKRREWARRGLPERLIDMAVELATNWASEISRWSIKHLEGVLPREELERVEKEILAKYLKEGLDRVAEKWIREMYGL